MPPHIYKATTSGVDIFDYDTGDFINRIPISIGVTSVWADEDHVYFSTTYSGTFLATVSGLETWQPYKQEPDITSNEVRYIHGNGDYICATTVSGVDRYKISTGDREYITLSDAHKCFQVNTGDYYYATNPVSGTSTLHAVYESGGGHTYLAQQDAVIGDVSINDIYVTEGTSEYSYGNVLFLATTSGAYVIEERRGDEDNCRKKIYYIES